MNTMNPTDLKKIITIWGLSILSFCILILCGMGFYALITGKTLEGVGLIVSGLFGICMLLLGYWWGSSSSSANKSTTIDNILSKTDEVSK